MEDALLYRCIAVVLWLGVVMAVDEAAPPTGLYFMLGHITLLPGSSVLFSDIGHHPHDRADPGSTLVCVTANVNRHCCRGADGENVGEWYYPDGSLVPRPFNTENPTLFRVGYTHQLRLGTQGDPVGPFGMYTCEVPTSITGLKVNASIIINGSYPVQRPSPPTNMTSVAQTTSVFLAWSQPSRDVVDSYEIEFEAVGDCIGAPANNAVRRTNGTQYNLSGLEENLQYKITLSSHNSARSSASSKPLYVTTLPSAPQCCIPEPNIDFINSSSFTVSWNREDCLSRNGDVRYYMVRYRQLGSSKILGSSKVNTNHRVFTATSVSHRTSYVFEVALVNEVGEGPFTRKNLTTSYVPYTGYIGSKPYPNNSRISIDDIGEEEEAGLHCFTELKTCCRSNDNPSGIPAGYWLLPNGLVAGNQNDSEITEFSGTRDRSCVILHRGSQSTGPTGIFTCVVPDVNGELLKVYFTVYNGQGDNLAPFQTTRQPPLESNTHQVLIYAACVAVAVFIIVLLIIIIIITVVCVRQRITRNSTKSKLNNLTLEKSGAHFLEETNKYSVPECDLYDKDEYMDMSFHQKAKGGDVSKAFSHDYTNLPSFKETSLKKDNADGKDAVIYEAVQ